jgi:hypothetical protein
VLLFTVSFANSIHLSALSSKGFTFVLLFTVSIVNSIHFRRLSMSSSKPKGFLYIRVTVVNSYYSIPLLTDAFTVLHIDYIFY